MLNFVLFYWHLKSQITTGDLSGLSNGIDWQLVMNHLGSILFLSSWVK